MEKYTYYFEIAKKIKTPLVIPKATNYVKYRLLKKKPVVKYYTPQIVAVNLINRCNLSCNYCAQAKDGVFKKPKEEMTLELIKEFFSHKLLKNCMLVDLLGGEPLLCKDIIPIVEYLSRKGFLTNTSTNGLLLANNIEKLRDAGITRVNVSVYPDNFNILKNSLSSINRIYQVHASYVLTKTILEKSKQSVFDVVDLAYSSGCKSLRFWMYRPLGKIPNNDEVVLDDSPIYKEFKEELMERYSDFVLFPQTVSRSYEKKCTQLWQRVSITPTGGIGICCGNFGHIKNKTICNNSFEEIFNCTQVVDIRKNLLDNSIPPLEECKNCNLLSETGW